MGDWSGPITTARARIITSRALCGRPTFRAHGTDCRYLVRDMDGAQDDCAVRERDDLCTLIPATRPTVIDFECEPDEAADLSALVAELRPHAGARLHLAAPAKIAAASGGRRAGSIEITTRKPKCSTS